MIVLAVVLALVVVGWLIYSVVRLFQDNRLQYPVLLATPIRGADYAQPADAPTQFPVVDRATAGAEGIRLPYSGNDLLFLGGGDDDGGAERIVPAAMPPINHQVQMTLSFWMRGENVLQPYATAAGDVAYATLFAQSVDQFVVKYDAMNNVLAVTVNLYPKYGADKSQTYAFSEVRVQAWQHFIVVLDNRALDLFVDGTLRQSRQLPNVPSLATNTWRLFPGTTPFIGTVSCARYFDYALNRHEVKRLFGITRPSDKNTAPTVGYFFWWTWYRGGSASALFFPVVNEETLDDVAERSGKYVRDIRTEITSSNEMQYLGAK